MKEKVGVPKGGALERSWRDSSPVAVAVAVVVADGAIVGGICMPCVPCAPALPGVIGFAAAGIGCGGQRYSL